LGCGEGEKLTFTTAPLSDGKGPGDPKRLEDVRVSVEKKLFSGYPLHALKITHLSGMKNPPLSPFYKGG
jgi:hypothetical protein